MLNFAFLLTGILGLPLNTSWRLNGIKGYIINIYLLKYHLCVVRPVVNTRLKMLKLPGRFGFFFLDLLPLFCLLTRKFWWWQFRVKDIYIFTTKYIITAGDCADHSLKDIFIKSLYLYLLAYVEQNVNKCNLVHPGNDGHNLLHLKYRTSKMPSVMRISLHTTGMMSESWDRRFLSCSVSATWGDKFKQIQNSINLNEMFSYIA